MYILRLLALMTMALAACTPPAPPAAMNYHVAAPIPALVIAFASGSDEPAPPDADRLRILGASMPAWIKPELHAVGPHTLARARSVRRLLGRPLVLFADLPEEPTSQNVFVLVTPPTTGIVAEACLGRGALVIGDVWPGDDARRTALLPAGCAVAMSLQAQVEAASAGQDLLRGRPLPATAATPFADAIERYYHRNDPNQHNNATPAGGTGRDGADTTTGFQGKAGQTDGSTPANPLLGPLPAAPVAAP